MDFISTRNKNAKVCGAQAIVNGISDDGGLYVPTEFPQVSSEQIKKFCGADYSETAAAVVGSFLPELSDLSEYTEQAYSKFDGDPAPVVKVDDNIYFMELWHGPTHAFKDIALTLLPYLMTGSKKLLGDDKITLIPVATSGDTGKAALEGFKNVSGTAVAVFYPEGGVSTLQQLQMQTTTGNNVFVSAIKGNFDDAQTAVKNAFVNAELNKELGNMGVELSSANSINFGRLAPQITYYFTAYADMVDGGKIKLGDKVNFCVPSGNFGDILAGYYAKKMGLPVNKLICASNRNNVLTDFINTGRYDVRREFYKTTSPSMDILISSNLERLIFDISGNNDNVTAQRMASLKQTGVYEITEFELKVMQQTFAAGCATEEEAAQTIRNYFDEYGYIIDPHTAVAACVAEKLNCFDLPTVILSTASPHKFAPVVLRAIGESPSGNELRDLRSLEDITALEIPQTLSQLPDAEKRFDGCVDLQDVNGTLIKFATEINKWKEKTKK